MAFRLSENETKLAGQLAIVLSVGFCVTTLVIPIANHFLTKPLDISLDVSIPYVVGVTALFVTYVYGRLEYAVSKEEQVLSQPYHGVEFFYSSETFLARLTELTVGATSVSTLNLSSPLGRIEPLDNYFAHVHKYILGGTELESFRSLASVDTPAKLDWLVKRTTLLMRSGKASFAVLRQVKVGTMPLGFHVIMRGPDGFVFFYPPVDLTGQMQSFLIKSTGVAEMVLHYFDLLWAASPKICQGKVPSQEGLAFLGTIDPNITKSREYQVLLKEAE